MYSRDMLPSEFNTKIMAQKKLAKNFFELYDGCEMLKQKIRSHGQYNHAIFFGMITVYFGVHACIFQTPPRWLKDPITREIPSNYDDLPRMLSYITFTFAFLMIASIFAARWKIIDNDNTPLETALTNFIKVLKSMNDESKRVIFINITDPNLSIRKLTEQLKQIKLKSIDFIDIKNNLTVLTDQISHDLKNQDMAGYFSKNLTSAEVTTRKENHLYINVEGNMSMQGRVKLQN